MEDRFVNKSHFIDWENETPRAEINILKITQ